MANKVTVGDRAPGFELEGTDGTDAGRRRYSLAEFVGTPVVLVFYPADNSPVCTVQLTSYSNDIAALHAVGAQVLAVSPQGVASHDEFERRHGHFAFPLLADVDKAVGGAYGILGPMGFYRRALFVIDAEGMVSYAHRSVTSLTFRPTDEIVDAVRALR
jgi:peroxiredoxin Q/BCP